MRRNSRSCWLLSHPLTIELALLDKVSHLISCKMLLRCKKVSHSILETRVLAIKSSPNPLRPAQRILTFSKGCHKVGRSTSKWRPLASILRGLKRGTRWGIRRRGRRRLGRTSAKSSVAFPDPQAAPQSSQTTISLREPTTTRAMARITSREVRWMQQGKNNCSTPASRKVRAPPFYAKNSWSPSENYRLLTRPLLRWLIDKMFLHAKTATTPIQVLIVVPWERETGICAGRAWRGSRARGCIMCRGTIKTLP